MWRRAGKTYTQAQLTCCFAGLQKVYIIWPNGTVRQTQRKKGKGNVQKEQHKWLTEEAKRSNSLVTCELKKKRNSLSIWQNTNGGEAQSEREWSLLFGGEEERSAACEILLLAPGIDSGPRQWEHRVPLDCQWIPGHSFCRRELGKNYQHLKCTLNLGRPGFEA